MKLTDPVTSLRGLGPKKATALEKLNVTTLEDLIYLFPRDYQDRRVITPITNIEEGEWTCICAKAIRLVQNYYAGGRKNSLRVYVSDDSGSTQILFFNARYLMKYFKQGEGYAFYGKVSRGRSGLQMVHPDFCREEEREEGIIPIYPLTKGITQKDIRGWQKQMRCLYEEDEIRDPYDERFRSRNKLMDLTSAIRMMHAPEDRKTFLHARYRHIFDELFLMQAGLMAIRARGDVREGAPFEKEPVEEEFISKLPFPLTKAQSRCAEEIMSDLTSGKVMNRLVQGDVGSGKTAVAQIAIYKTAKNAYQSVMMAPTEILAAQHFGSMKEAFDGTNIRVGFLTSSLKAAKKRETLEKLEKGEIDLLVGTHAVIQPEVKFKNLGLVITDEQHRFGVDQRMNLRKKGEDPNVLVMTATPIPRTLAAVLYADLDISVIDEMPPGRKPVITRTMSAKERSKCYDLVEKELEAGHQAYVVTPLIDESEVLDVKSAQEVCAELRHRFNDKSGHGSYRVELLHGAMKQAEKDEVMEGFAKGDVDLIVATVVIEVGINVPNASVMVIENAERFGLAQMHQLRGRVGRGRDQAYCYLIPEGESEIASKRCEIMEASTDGFYIAEEDLKLRGPGDIFGTRQHGLPQLNMADLIHHADILKHARDEAKKLIETDPDLSEPKHAKLKARLDKMFSEGKGAEL